MRNVHSVRRASRYFGRFWGWMTVPGIRTTFLRLSWLLLLACAANAEAQTTFVRLAWTMPGMVLADVQAVQYTLKIDAATPIPLTASCTAAVPPAVNPTCLAPLPTMTGSHTLVLIASNPFGSQSSDPLQVGPPNKPALITVTFAQVP